MKIRNILIDRREDFEAPILEHFSYTYYLKIWRIVERDSYQIIWNQIVDKVWDELLEITNEN